MKKIKTFDSFINENKDPKMLTEKRLKMSKLRRLLMDATRQAEELGIMSGHYEELFDGTEAQDIAENLRDIYNAFMTGDKYNDEFADQIFKK